MKDRWNVMSGKTKSILIVFLMIISCSYIATAKDVFSPVIIDYFYEPGCSDCARVQEQIFPELQERFETFYTINKYDIGIKTNIMRLIAYQDKLDIREDESVCMVLDYKHVFNGYKNIEHGLLLQIDQCVAGRLDPDWKSPEPVQIPNDAVDGLELAKDRASTFKIVAVSIGGLTDGINPCAIGTLVFFMSLLGVSRIRGRGLIMMGVAFCSASFVTYTAIGFGLLRVLHVATGFSVAQMIIEWGMMGMLGVFACLSFLDAYRYQISGNAKDIRLQLPRGIKDRIHKIMRENLTQRRKDAKWGEGGGDGRLVFGGIIIGAAVTALESVCTGQVYVPTLVLLIMKGEAVTKAWPLLLLYNTMFILPLVIVFILTYFGLRTEKLLIWSKHNVIPSKILLGIFFLAMAIFILVM